MIYTRKLSFYVTIFFENKLGSSMPAYVMKATNFSIQPTNYYNRRIRNNGFFYKKISWIGYFIDTFGRSNPRVFEHFVSHTSIEIRRFPILDALPSIVYPSDHLVP